MSAITCQKIHGTKLLSSTHLVVIRPDVNNASSLIQRRERHIRRHPRNISLQSESGLAVMEPVKAQLILIRIPRLRSIHYDRLVQTIRYFERVEAAGAVHYGYRDVIDLRRIAVDAPSHPRCKVVLERLTPSPDTDVFAEEGVVILPDGKVGCVAVGGSQAGGIGEDVPAAPATPFWMFWRVESVGKQTEEGGSVALHDV